MSGGRSHRLQARRVTDGSREAAANGSRPEGILLPGRTCWRREHADRVAFLIDGEQYYAALDAVLESARRSVWLIGWDFHGDIRLTRGEGEGAAPSLTERLSALLRRRRDLHVYVLEWDFAAIYAFERQLLPRLRFRGRRRFHFQLDAEHPPGASHHQKLVVVDERIAFCGGFDVAAGRWDTREHRAQDSRRDDPSVGRYGPFHDVQILVDGHAAAALADLARERWYAATGRRIAPRRPSGDPWPAHVEPQLRGVNVGIARTAPAYGERPEAREIEALVIAAIRAARQSIYVENQYFTAGRVGAAIADRLREANGPEVVLVLSYACSGWLEDASMGALRRRLLRQLAEADRGGRLRVFHPVVPDVAPADYTLHSKLIVCDDALAVVGSANLSNRSMGLDTELALALDGAERPDVAATIGALRDDLLGEHLGVEPDRVARERARSGSLVAAIDALRGGQRTLVPLPEEEPGWIDDLVGDGELVDPERPIDADRLLGRWLPHPAEPPRRRVWPAAATALAVLLVLGALWRWTPLSEWVTPQGIAALADPLRGSAGGGFVATVAVALAGVVFVPITALMVASALVFGPLAGFAVALAGSLASAAIGFALGRIWLGDRVRAFDGPRVRRVRRQLARRGVAAIAVLRIVPVAPFAAVNVVAGASSLRFRDYLLGSAVAMAPGTLAIAFLTDRTARVIAAPGLETTAVLVALAALVWIAWWWVRRRLAGASGE